MSESASGSMSLIFLPSRGCAAYSSTWGTFTMSWMKGKPPCEEGESAVVRRTRRTATQCCAILRDFDYVPDIASRTGQPPSPGSYGTHLDKFDIRVGMGERTETTSHASSGTVDCDLGWGHVSVVCLRLEKGV